MTEEYKDLCIEIPDNTTDIAAANAPTAPWRPMESAGYSAADSLRDPASDFEEAVTRREIDRGLIQIGKREIKMYPQQFVYNFPEFNALPNRRYYQVGLNKPFLQSTGLTVRQPPSMNPADYKSTESIKNVINLQDPLRFVSGKVFSEISGRRHIQVEQEQSRFSILNNKALPSLGRPNEGDEGTYPLAGEQDPELAIYIPMPNRANADWDYDDYTHFASVEVTCHLEAQRYYRLEVTPNQVNFADSEPLQAGREYLKTLIPSEDKIFEDTRFKTHAAFHKSELDHMETFPKFYAEAKVVTPLRDSPAEQRYAHTQPLSERQSGYYQVESPERKNLKNIYEGFLSSSIAHDESFRNRLISQGYRADIVLYDAETYDDCAEQAVVEKYPASEIELIGRLNNLIFSNIEEEEPGDRKRWIDVNSDGFVELSFRMPNPEESNWARHFKDNYADIPFLTMLDNLHSRRLPDSPPIYDTLYAYNLEMSVLDDQSPNEQDDFYRAPDLENPYYSPNEKTVFEYRPRKVDHVFTYMREWLSSILPRNQSAAGRRVALNDYFSKKGFPLLFDRSESTFSAPGRSVLARRLRESPMHALADLDGSMYPSRSNNFTFNNSAMHPRKIFTEESCPSEILAFRVEKINTFSGQVLKEFYFFNNPETTDFTFIDNEVSIGGKYKYNIYAINLVAGVKYQYSNPSTDNSGLARVIQDTGRINPDIEFKLKIFPHHKIVETPYFSQDVTFVDLPPVHPSVSLHKMTSGANTDTSFRYLFSPRIDHTAEVPISLRSGDQELISSMIQAQSSVSISDLEPGAVRYSSDTKPTHYEMFVLDEAPIGYSDFQNADYYETTADAPYFNFIAPENQDRYLVFRTRDLGGISNPGPMFRFRFNKYGDGSYHEFEIYEPVDTSALDPLTCERYLSIRPSSIQSSYDFGLGQQPSQDDLRILLGTAPEIDSVSIGLAPEQSSIWGKRYKIRLKSRATGRMIDFNFDYELSRRPSDSSSGSRSASLDAHCAVQTIEKNENIEQSYVSSRQAIVERSSQPASQPGPREGPNGPGNDDY